MELRGTIMAVLPEACGTSKAGEPWKKREYVIETDERWPHTLLVAEFGDAPADRAPIQVGDRVSAQIDIDSREVNGRWYTSVTAHALRVNLLG